MLSTGSFESRGTSVLGWELESFAKREEHFANSFILTTNSLSHFPAFVNADYARGSWRPG